MYGVGQHPCAATQAALTFMTTHYTEVKEEATKNPVFINASVDFDLDTLKPTYRLSWGTEGSSNALVVAHQLGFDRQVLARGKEWVDRLSHLSESKSKASHVTAEIMVTLIRTRLHFMCTTVILYTTALANAVGSTSTLNELPARLVACT